jgi:hypothetical protein
MTTYPSFPTLSQKEDQQYFGRTSDDPAIKAPVEGGYEITRPRYTRPPRRIWKTGFSLLTEADIAALDSFWTTVQGGSLAFNYTLPTSGETVLVRFNKAFNATPMAWQKAVPAKGIAKSLLYQISDMELKEV